jgi:hypothetical protein
MKAKAKRVKEHPYNDVTAAWLRENDDALVKLQQLQERANKEVRKVALLNAEAWLNYCCEHDAPKAVIAQAERNYNIAKARV